LWGLCRPDRLRSLLVTSGATRQLVRVFFYYRMKACRVFGALSLQFQVCRRRAIDVRVVFSLVVLFSGLGPNGFFSPVLGASLSRSRVCSARALWIPWHLVFTCISLHCGWDPSLMPRPPHCPPRHVTCGSSVIWRGLHVHRLVQICSSYWYPV
jgi:hypothetical protein